MKCLFGIDLSATFAHKFRVNIDFGFKIQNCISNLKI